METEKKQDKLYEIAYLVPQDAGEEGLNRVREDIRNIIGKTDGAVEKELNPTPVRLAYPVQRKKQAFLGVSYFRTTPANIKILKDGLKHHKDIMRFTINKPAAHPDQMMAAAASAARPAERTIKPDEPKKEISKAELDQKLEKILEEEVKV